MKELGKVHCFAWSRCDVCQVSLCASQLSESESFLGRGWWRRYRSIHLGTRKQDLYSSPLTVSFLSVGTGTWHVRSSYTPLFAFWYTCRYHISPLKEGEMWYLLGLMHWCMGPFERSSQSPSQIKPAHCILIRKNNHLCVWLDWRVSTNPAAKSTGPLWNAAPPQQPESRWSCFKLTSPNMLPLKQDSEKDPCVCLWCLTKSPSLQSPGK